MYYKDTSVKVTFPVVDLTNSYTTIGRVNPEKMSRHLIRTHGHLIYIAVR